jgi:hypothetical protein
VPHRACPALEDSMLDKLLVPFVCALVGTVLARPAAPQ